MTSYSAIFVGTIKRKEHTAKVIIDVEQSKGNVTKPRLRVLSAKETFFRKIVLGADVSAGKDSDT